MKIKLEKITECLFYLFVFFLPFQTKYIVKTAETNYNEIAIFLNYLILLVLLVTFLFLFFKKNKNKNDFEIPKHYLILVGLDLFVFISIFLSPVFNVSLVRYFFFLLSVSLLFLILNLKINTKKTLLFFILSIFLSSLFALSQFFSQEVFANKYLGVAVHDPSILGVSVLEGSFGRFVRAYGGLDHPNIFGAMTFFALIFSLFLFLKYKFNWQEKILFYITYFVLFLGLIVSFSRSAWLALFSSLILILFLLLFEKKKDDLKKYLKLLLFSLVFSLVFSFILKDLIISRFDNNSRLENISRNERIEQIQGSSSIIRNNLWLGVGYGAYHQKLINLNPEIKAYQAQPVHNVFLLVLSEIGIWGLISFLWFLIYIFIESSKGNYYFINYSLFLGLFIFMIFDHWLWSLVFGTLFLFFILGISLKIDDN
jgi:O-antigen ligase